jgi:hypothetical protein
VGFAALKIVWIAVDIRRFSIHYNQMPEEHPKDRASPSSLELLFMVKSGKVRRIFSSSLAMELRITGRDTH